MTKPMSVKTIEQARSDFSKHWSANPIEERISIDEAMGRILSEEVTSKLDLPPFDRSIYDGYAVKSEDSFEAGEENPVTLELKGRILAGKPTEKEVKSGKCMEISTGAPIPKGADAVVMVEDTTISEKDKIDIRRAVSPGKNIYNRGDEIEAGEKIVASDKKISPQIRGALIACGVESVCVVKKPTVGLISTGDELVEAGRKIKPGQIYDINSHTISDSIKKCGGKPTNLGIANDSPEEIREKLVKAIDGFDMIITSGGSSAGSSDIVPDIIEEIGDPGVIVHGLAQKPGKPTILAVIDKKPVFGLPGYPVSALMEFDQIVAPYLRELSAQTQPERESLHAKITKKILSARGRRELVPVTLKEESEETSATPLRKGSGAITSLARADGYITIPLSKEIVQVGETVKVKLFGGGELA